MLSLGMRLTGMRRGAPANLLPFSSSLDNAAWTKTQFLAFGAGSEAEAAVAPNGRMEADLLTENTASAARSFSRSVTIPAGRTISRGLWVKRSSGTRHIRVQVSSDAGANSFGAYFDLDTNAVGPTLTTGTGVLAAQGVEVWPDTWLRVWVAGTVDPAATSTSATAFFQTAPSGAASYTGDGTSGLYIWGNSFELQARPSPGHWFL